MSDISINAGSIESSISSLVSNIESKIITASATSGNTIIDAIEHSSGDLIASFKEEITCEVEVINSVGELLISMANYIKSAKDAFVYVDTAYKSSKI